jgi:hypothetical protein
VSTISSGIKGPRERTALDGLNLDLGRATPHRKGDMRRNQSQW